MINNFPIWLVAIDYFLACLMVILLINFILNLFLSEASNFILYRFITKLANPIINITNKITPSFIVQPLIPMYIAWLIFMIRIYFLPLLFNISLQLGIGLCGLSLPLKFNNQATFSGAVTKRQSDLSFLRYFNTLLILDLLFSPATVSSIK